MSLHQKPVGLPHLQTGAKISFLTTFSFSIFFVIPPKGGEGGVSNVRETLAVTSLSSSSSTLLQRCNVTAFKSQLDLSDRILSD